jgi:hypothetical protein
LVIPVRASQVGQKVRVGCDARSMSDSSKARFSFISPKNISELRLELNGGSM